MAYTETERERVCVRNKRQKGSEWMNKTESKEVVNQISYVRLAFRCRSFLWLVLTWIMIQCHLSTQIFVVIFIYLCVVCYIFFLVPFFSKERCLIDNDLAINFMFVSLAVHFGLCSFCLITFSQAIGDLIRFITLHLQPILPIYIPFFYSFSFSFSFSCFINIRQIGSVFFFLLKSISFVAVTDINYPRVLKAGLPFGWAFNIETVIVVVDSFNRHNLLSH